MWGKCEVKWNHTGHLFWNLNIPKHLFCLLAMLHDRQNVKWNLNCVLIGCDCHIQPWTSASARPLEAIGHLLKQLVCHLHFITFRLATLPARDACRVCRFYSSSTELSFCLHWVLLLQGVVSAGGVMRHWPAVKFRASTHRSCGVRSTTGTVGKIGNSPWKEVWSTARLLKISPEIQSFVPGLVGQPQVPNSVRFSLTVSFFLINRICVKLLCVSDVGRSPVVILHETKSPASAGQDQ